MVKIKNGLILFKSFENNHSQWQSMQKPLSCAGKNRAVMNTPQISIVMPVYNSEKFVEQAIRSLLVQTFMDFELIIVDDGSTDGSTDIVKQFDDERIRVFTNDKNQGIVYSRNRGLAEIRGRFYAPFDSDDVAVPHKFQKQISFLKQNPDIAMTGSWARLMDKTGKPTGERWKLGANPNTIPSIMLFRNYFVHSSLLVRRKAIETVVYQEGLDVVEDYRFCADLSFQHKVCNYPEYLIDYRVHGKSAMRSDDKRMRNQDIKIYRYLFRRLGMELSESDLNCIFALKGKTRIGDFILLQEIHGFLLTILNRNKEIRMFNRKALERVVAHRWLKACYLARHHHVKLLTTMISSPLTRLLLKS